MLTIKELKEMEPDTIFASGISLIVHPWYHQATLVSEGGCLEPDHKHTKVKWVAVRGGIHDWAIYHSLDANICHDDYLNGLEHLEADNDLIYRAGAKLRNEEDIKNLVPCDEDAFNMYRY